MTTEMHQDRPLQNSLFPEPVGDRLRAARERAGLSREQVALRLRLPSAVVVAMESDDWQRLGAPIYVRSNLGAYLELLDLPPGLVEGPAGSTATPRLAAMDSRSRLQGMIESGVRNAVYLTMTAVIAVPAVWLASHYGGGRQLAAVISLEADAVPVTVTPALPAEEVRFAASSLIDPEPELPTAALALAPAADPMPATPRAEPAGNLPPVVAAMTAFPRAAPEANGEATLRLAFRGDSWLEVATEGGRSIERELVRAGGEREYPLRETLRITLGNADAVDVRRGSTSIDLAPFRSANVARFAVSSADVSSAGR